MKILLVSWVLLLLGVNINSGHYIRPLEDAHSDFYRVAEDESGVRFVNSKPEKPTLREILYYHIVERPFGKQEPVLTERSFTNSHGLQFLKDASSDSIEQVDDNHEEYQENEESEHDNKLEDEIQNEREESEPVTEPKPLTDEDVKEAYKHRSYLFDQLRQRYSPLKRMIPDSLSRSKRQADYEEIPSAPEFPESSRDAYIQPNTYGMKLESDGGYVWNNLNNPPLYYEVGKSTENPNEGQNVSGQTQEILPPETNVPQVTESTDSDSSEDIYVSTDRQPTSQGNIEETPEYVSVVDTAEPVENPDNESVVSEITPVENPDNESVVSEITPVDNPDNESVVSEITPVENPDNESLVSEIPEPVENPENEPEVAENPIENPSLSLESTDASESPIEPILSDPLPEDNTGDEKPKFEIPENPSSDEAEKPVEIPAEELETAEESSTEASNGEPMVMPEAPTLPPLNYDSLPGYIRDAISSTERSESQEQTENPYVNPQLDPEDKKTVEEKMEDIFATAQPVEEIPKTYGVNLTGDSGQVWNDMVNPPIYHNVGTENKEEEPKAPEPSVQPNQENQEQPKPEGQPELENPEVETTELPESENPEENLEETQPEEQPELENPEGEATELPELENPEQNKPEENLEETQPEEQPELENPEGEALELPELENPEQNKPEETQTHEHPESENPEGEATELPELENPEGEATELPELENPEQNKPEENLEETQPEEQPELENPEGEATELPELENPEQNKPEENLEETQPEEQPELENPEGEATELPELENPEQNKPEENLEETQTHEHPESENQEPALNPEESVETEVGTAIPVEESNPESEIPYPDEEDTGDELTASQPDRKPDIMSELLKSDQFWAWLGEWTATYMELIEKHVRKIAIQEICNHEKSRDMCLLTDSEDTGLTIKDGKIILDGKEIPVTHTSNFDGLRRGYKKEGNRVDATTIYGNSVGNEKVNNVFIFNAVDAKEILEEFKPSNDSKIDFIIDERGQENKGIDDKENDKVSDDINGKIGEIPQDDDIEPPSDDIQVKVDEISKDDGIGKIDEIPKDDIEESIKEERIEINKDQDAEDKPISSEMESEGTTKMPLKE